jgi:hypothetical protein
MIRRLCGNIFTRVRTKDDRRPGANSSTRRPNFYCVGFAARARMPACARMCLTYSKIREEGSEMRVGQQPAADTDTLQSAFTSLFSRRCRNMQAGGECAMAGNCHLSPTRAVSARTWSADYSPTAGAGVCRTLEHWHQLSAHMYTGASTCIRIAFVCRDTRTHAESSK